jgi:hypothetical protein
VAPGLAPSAMNLWRCSWLSHRCAHASVGSGAALRRARQTASHALPMHLGGRCTPAIRAGRRRREPWRDAHATVLHASPLRTGQKACPSALPARLPAMCCPPCEAIVCLQVRPILALLCFAVSMELDVICVLIERGKKLCCGVSQTDAYM